MNALARRKVERTVTINRSLDQFLIKKCTDVGSKLSIPFCTCCFRIRVTSAFNDGILMQGSFRRRDRRLSPAVATAASLPVPLCGCKFAARSRGLNKAKVNVLIKPLAHQCPLNPKTAVEKRTPPEVAEEPETPIEAGMEAYARVVKVES